MKTQNKTNTPVWFGPFVLFGLAILNLVLPRMALATRPSSGVNGLGVLPPSKGHTAAYASPPTQHITQHPMGVSSNITTARSVVVKVKKAAYQSIGFLNHNVGIEAFGNQVLSQVKHLVMYGENSIYFNQYHTLLNRAAQNFATTLLKSGLSIAEVQKRTLEFVGSSAHFQGSQAVHTKAQICALSNLEISETWIPRVRDDAHRMVESVEKHAFFGPALDHLWAEFETRHGFLVTPEEVKRTVAKASSAINDRQPGKKSILSHHINVRPEDFED